MTTTTNVNYKEIDDTVLSYQRSSPHAAEQLIKRFTPLILKYVALIADTNPVNIDKYATRFFISLFIKSKDMRARVRAKYRSETTNSLAINILESIRSQCSIFSYDDIYNEAVAVLLKLARSYVPDKGFCAYVKKAFKFEFAQSIKKMIRNTPSNTVPFNSIAHLCHYEHVYPSFKQCAELNTKWVYGYECSELFYGFTPLERLLLKLSYVDKETDIQIGKRVGLHRNTIGRRRKKIINTLAQRATERKLLIEA